LTPRNTFPVRTSDFERGEARDAFLMLFEDAHNLSGSWVPQADRFVVCARGEGDASVDFERGEAGDLTLVPFQDAQHLSGSRVPQADGAVKRG
jgi:hypothetical protein